MKMLQQYPKHELAAVLQLHKDDLNTLVSNPWKQRTLFAISRCRTAEMGGHIDQCNNDSCNKLHLSYNSCRNRHCPKCQGHLKEKWIEAREQELLNTAYFHVVFTLPDHLNELALAKPAFLYSLLFKTAWGVIRDFAANPKFLGAKTGMIAVLHTWGQNLGLHPHLHCIVPAGGVSESEKWKATKSEGKYLFPVKKMSQVFRARFVEELRKQKTIQEDVFKKLFAKRWVVYCKQPFFGPKQVIEYLGRYTHKIAISNHRIKAIKEGRVHFSAKDYKKGGQKVPLVLEQKEFIRRFSLHILPKGFTRIRHYGILSSSTKVKYKELIDDQLGSVTIDLTKKKSSMLNLCPYCRKGQLETVAVFDQRGPPGYWKKRLLNTQ